MRRKSFLLKIIAFLTTLSFTFTSTIAYSDVPAIASFFSKKENLFHLSERAFRNQNPELVRSELRLDELQRETVTSGQLLAASENKNGSLTTSNQPLNTQSRAELRISDRVGRVPQPNSTNSVLALRHSSSKPIASKSELYSTRSELRHSSSKPIASKSELRAGGIKPDSGHPGSRTRVSRSSRFLNPNLIRKITDNEDFIQAAAYFNSHIIKSRLTWEKIIDLYELLRGDRRNNEYTQSVREERLRSVKEILPTQTELETWKRLRNDKTSFRRLEYGKFFSERQGLRRRWFAEYLHPENTIDIVHVANSHFNNDNDIISNAAKLYYSVGMFQPFSGLPGFREIKPLSPEAIKDPASGHHRLAWFIVNYFLIGNGYAPLYFEKLTLFHEDEELRTLLEKHIKKIRSVERALQADRSDRLSELRVLDESTSNETPEIDQGSLKNVLFKKGLLAVLTLSAGIGISFVSVFSARIFLYPLFQVSVQYLLFIVNLSFLNMVASYLSHWKNVPAQRWSLAKKYTLMSLIVQTVWFVLKPQILIFYSGVNIQPWWVASCLMAVTDALLNLPLTYFQFWVRKHIYKLTSAEFHLEVKDKYLHLYRFVTVIFFPVNFLFYSLPVDLAYVIPIVNVVAGFVVSIGNSFILDVKKYVVPSRSFRAWKNKILSYWVSYSPHFALEQDYLWRLLVWLHLAPDFFSSENDRALREFLRAHQLFHQRYFYFLKAAEQMYMAKTRKNETDFLDQLNQLNSNDLQSVVGREQAVWQKNAWTSFRARWARRIYMEVGIAPPLLVYLGLIAYLIFSPESSLCENVGRLFITGIAFLGLYFGSRLVATRLYPDYPHHFEEFILRRLFLGPGLLKHRAALKFAHQNWIREVLLERLGRTGRSELRSEIIASGLDSSADGIVLLIKTLAAALPFVVGALVVGVALYLLPSFLNRLWQQSRWLPNLIRQVQFDHWSERGAISWKLYQLRKKIPQNQRNIFFNIVMPIVVEKAVHSTNLSKVLDQLIKLADAGSENNVGFPFGIQESAEAARSFEELMEFLKFATTLLEKGINPSKLLANVAPVVVRVSENKEEAVDLLKQFHDLAELLKARGFHDYVFNSLVAGFSTPPFDTIFVGVKSLGALKQYLDMNRRLVEVGIPPIDLPVYKDSVLPEIASSEDTLTDFVTAAQSFISRMEPNDRPYVWIYLKGKIPSKKSPAALLDFLRSGNVDIAAHHANAPNTGKVPTVGPEGNLPTSDETSTSRSELRSLASNGKHIKRFVITDELIEQVVAELLARKKVKDLARPPFVHFERVSVKEVALALGVQENSLMKYLQRADKEPENFRMYQPTKVLTPERVRWAVLEIKKEKEKRVRDAEGREGKANQIIVLQSEVASVFGVGQDAVNGFLSRNPPPDHFGMTIPEKVDPKGRAQNLKATIVRLKEERNGGEVTIQDLVERSGVSYDVLGKMSKQLIAWGMSPGGSGSHRELPRFKEWVRALSLEQREDLIAFILYLYDQKAISFSQAYILIHLIRYLDTPFDYYKKIKEVLRLSNVKTVSMLLHGQAVKVQRGGALDAVEDQPEVKAFLEYGIPIAEDSISRLRRLLLVRSSRLPPFRVRAKKEESSRGFELIPLTPEQRSQIVLAALRGTPKTEIARRLPELVGDLNLEPVSDTTIGYFLHREEKTKEAKGALPQLLKLLEDFGLFQAGKIDVTALRTWAENAPAIYRIGGARIFQPSADKNPEEIRSSLGVLRREKTPFARLIREFSDYVAQNQYPFDLSGSTYAALVDEVRINDPDFAREIGLYFSDYVVPVTGRPLDFVDALLYMLQPLRTSYYFNREETAAFFANVYFAISPQHLQKKWLEVLAQYAGGLVPGRGKRRSFATNVYEGFIREAFPKVRFMSQAEIDSTSHAARRGVILVDETKRYDADFLYQKAEEYRRKTEQVETLIHGLLQKTTFEAIARKWRIPEENLDLVYEAAVEAAWDYDPTMESGASFYTVVNRYVLQKKRKAWKMSKAKKRKYVRQFSFDEEGRAVELEVTEAPGKAILPSLAESEYVKTRMAELQKALSENFTPVEQAVFNLANGFDTDAAYQELTMYYGDIAQVLVERGLKEEEHVLSKERIRQILERTTARLTQILNQPSGENLKQWREFLYAPKEASSLPDPIRRDVVGGRIPVMDSVELAGYKVKEGSPVVVVAVRSRTSEASEGGHYIILEVSYLGKSKGASLLKFDWSGALILQERKETVEEASQLLRAIIESEAESSAADPRSELRHSPNRAGRASASPSSTAMSELRSEHSLPPSFISYLKRSNLYKYKYLRSSFSVPVQEILIEDSSMRPVFLAILPQSYVGEVQMVNPEVVEEIGGISVLQNHRAFQVGTARVANRMAKKGFRIIAGVVDKASDDFIPIGMSNIGFRVANGRTAYFPLKDGTWLGVRGSGQNQYPDKPPAFWAEDPIQKEWNFLGVSLASDIFQRIDPKKISRHLLADSPEIAVRTMNPRLPEDAPRERALTAFNEYLGYSPLFMIPDGKGGFVSADRFRMNNNKPVLMFMRTIHPHRLNKLPQLLKSDPDLQKLSGRISETLHRLGILNEHQMLSGAGLMKWIAQSFAFSEAVKINNGLFGVTRHEQDFNFIGQETVDALTDLPKAHRLFGTIQKFNMLLHLAAYASEAKQYQMLFPKPFEVFEGFFRTYFRYLNNGDLQAWTEDITQENWKNHPIHKVTGDSRLELFHPEADHFMFQSEEHKWQMIWTIVQWAQEQLSSRSELRTRLDEMSSWVERSLAPVLLSYPTKRFLQDLEKVKKTLPAESQRDFDAWDKVIHHFPSFRKIRHNENQIYITEQILYKLNSEFFIPRDLLLDAASGSQAYPFQGLTLRRIVKERHYQMQMPSHFDDISTYDIPVYHTNRLWGPPDTRLTYFNPTARWIVVMDDRVDDELSIALEIFESLKTEDGKRTFEMVFQTAPTDLYDRIVSLYAEMANEIKAAKKDAKERLLVQELQYAADYIAIDTGRYENEDHLEYLRRNVKPGGFMAQFIDDVLAQPREHLYETVEAARQFLTTEILTLDSYLTKAISSTYPKVLLFVFLGMIIQRMMLRADFPEISRIRHSYYFTAAVLPILLANHFHARDTQSLNEPALLGEQGIFSAQQLLLILDLMRRSDEKLRDAFRQIRDSEFSTEIKALPRLVKDVPPIWMPGSQIIDLESDIPRLVESPLVAAVKILFRKNIQTHWTSANADDVKKRSKDDNPDYPAHAYISLDRTTLSEENRQILTEVVSKMTWKYGPVKVVEKTALMIYIPITEETTEGELSEFTSVIADQLKLQELKWNRYTLENVLSYLDFALILADIVLKHQIKKALRRYANKKTIGEIEKVSGWIHDPETGYFYHSREQMRNAKAWEKSRSELHLPPSQSDKLASTAKSELRGEGAVANSEHVRRVMEEIRSRIRVVQALSGSIDLNVFEKLRGDRTAVDRKFSELQKQFLPQLMEANEYVIQIIQAILREDEETQHYMIDQALPRMQPLQTWMRNFYVLTGMQQWGFGGIFLTGDPKYQTTEQILKILREEIDKHRWATGKISNPSDTFPSAESRADFLERAQIAVRSIKHDPWNALFVYLDKLSVAMEKIPVSRRWSQAVENEYVNLNHRMFLYGEARTSRTFSDQELFDFSEALTLLRNLTLQEINPRINDNSLRESKPHIEYMRDRAMEIIEDLLSFVKGDIESRKTTFSLKEMVEKAYQLVFVERHWDILTTLWYIEEVSLAANGLENVMVRGDRRKILNILRILFINSKLVWLERNPDPKTRPALKLSVGFRKEAGNPVFEIYEVVDNAGGVRTDGTLLDYVAPLRQKAFQLNVSRRKGDTGLGLAEVWWLVKLHGGEIQFSNIVEQGEIRGAKFTITIPTSFRASDSSVQRSEFRFEPSRFLPNQNASALPSSPATSGLRGRKLQVLSGTRFQSNRDARDAKPTVSRSELRTPVPQADTFDIVESEMNRVLTPGVELTDREIGLYFGGETLKRTKKEGWRFYIKQLDPTKDFRFIQEWTNEFEQAYAWRENWKRDHSGQLVGFPRFPRLEEYSFGLVSEAGGKQQLEGYIQLRPFSLGSDLAGKGKEFELYISQMELYFRNIGRNKRLKGVIDLLFDFLIKFSVEASNFVQDGIELCPNTPGSRSFVAKRNFRGGSATYPKLEKGQVIAEFTTKHLAGLFNHRRLNIPRSEPRSELRNVSKSPIPPMIHLWGEALDLIGRARPFDVEHYFPSPLPVFSGHREQPNNPDPTLGFHYRGINSVRASIDMLRRGIIETNKTTYGGTLWNWERFLTNSIRRATMSLSVQPGFLFEITPEAAREFGTEESSNVKKPIPLSKVNHVWLVQASSPSLSDLKMIEIRLPGMSDVAVSSKLSRAYEENISRLGRSEPRVLSRVPTASAVGRKTLELPRIQSMRDAWDDDPSGRHPKQRSELRMNGDEAFRDLRSGLNALVPEAAVEKFRRAVESVQGQGTPTRESRARMRSELRSNGLSDQAESVGLIAANDFMSKFGASLLALARYDIPLVAVVTNRSELRFIDMMNEVLPDSQKIRAATTYQQARAELRLLGVRTARVIGSKEDASLIDLLLREKVIDRREDFIVIRERSELRTKLGISVEDWVVREGEAAHSLAMNV